MERGKIGLWILLGILWLINLPLRPLFDPDEGRYAEIPREMVASGDWVTPTLNGFKYFEKPPLQYWATATIYSVFGVHDWTSRLWSALLAFGCIPLVYAFMRQLGQSEESSWVAAALLAVNPYYAITGQLNLLDQGFTFFLSAAVFSFVVAQREHLRPRRSRSWMLLAWAALALAVLSKGIVAFVLAGATLALYSIVTRSAAPLRRLQLARGIPLFLLISAPWFWLVQSRNPEFSHFFFVHEHVERFLTTVHERVEPFWYFAPLVLIALLPVILNVRRWRLADLDATRAPGEFRAGLFLLLWCAVVLVFFSFSQSKLAPYVMPAMPALAVLLARVTRSDPLAFQRAKWVSIGLLFALAMGIMISGLHRLGGVSSASLAWTLVVAMLCVAYLSLDAMRRSVAPDALRRWIPLAAVSITGYQFLSMSYQASFPTISASTLAAAFETEVTTDVPLYSVGQYRHSMAFYLRRPLEIYDYSGEFAFGMRQAGLDPSVRRRREFLEHWWRQNRGIAIVDANDYITLAAAGMPGRVIARDGRSVVVARS